MARPAARIVALQFGLGAGLLLLVARAGWLQLVRGGEFARRAAAQRTVTTELPARRGTIYDRNGTPLAVSEPMYRVQLAVKEVRDTARLVDRAARALGVSRASLRRYFQRGSDEFYPYFHGPFRESRIAPIRGMRGVRLETVYSRGYPGLRLAAPVIGAVSLEAGGHGESGLERSLDSILAGRPGETVDLRTPSGQKFESPDRRVRDPVPGHDVVLTLDAQLQEIAENALRKALAEYKADAGDVLFLDPRTGELLALASLNESGMPGSATVFTSAFEPGSTAKPFTAATLLALGRIEGTETVSGENGSWTYPTRGRATRTIEDTHAEKAPMTLARVIEVSSNIGIAKFSRKLRWEEHYDMLRAFGFGAPTGVEYPSEATGALVRPDRWDPGYDAESMAMGYRIQMTPLQLALGYAVFANDGVLMAPTLVREIRSADRTVLYRMEPEVVRRVLPADIAAQMREMLRMAAGESGTGSQGQVLGGILGKTGTARQAEHGSYAGGKYRASFVAIYPAKDPQLVVAVTIQNPVGAYYGGQTAAPTTASMLKQALSARSSVIDRSAMAQTERRKDAKTQSEGEADIESSAAAVSLPLKHPPPRTSMARVPEVAGRAIRGAVFAVHQRGLRARVEGNGRVVVRSFPAAGDSLPVGKTVVLFVSPSRTP
jgi:cell division protein FtsI (penicillin-binding protein 3)